MASYRRSFGIIVLLMGAGVALIGANTDARAQQQEVPVFDLVGAPPGYTPPPPPTSAQLDAFQHQVRTQLYLPEFLPVNKQTMLGRDGSHWINYQTDGQSWTGVGRKDGNARTHTDRIIGAAGIARSRVGNNERCGWAASHPALPSCEKRIDR